MAARKKSPPGRLRAPAPTWLGKRPRRFAKSAKGWARVSSADSSPLKRIRNDKYLKAGSRRGAPRNDKCVKADSVRLREKSPHPGRVRAPAPTWLRKKSPPGRVRAPAPTWLGKSPRRFAKNAKGWGTPGQKADSSPLKRIRNDKYLKAGSRRGAPRNDKCVKADSLRLREKSPHPGG